MGRHQAIETFAASAQRNGFRVGWDLRNGKSGSYQIAENSTDVAGVLREFPAHADLWPSPAWMLASSLQGCTCQRATRSHVHKPAAGDLAHQSAQPIMQSPDKTPTKQATKKLSCKQLSFSINPQRETYLVSRKWNTWQFVPKAGAWAKLVPSAKPQLDRSSTCLV